MAARPRPLTYTSAVTPPEGVAERVRAVAGVHGAVRAVYLFGSHVKGEAREDSDLDLGVLYRTRQPLEVTVALEQALEQALCRRIDLVDVARVSAFLGLDIVRGERVFCRDAAEADQFELYVLRRAGDLLPFERQRQDMLMGRPR